MPTFTRARFAGKPLLAPLMASALSLAVAAPALAEKPADDPLLVQQDRGEVRSIRVNISDLDLQDRADVERLELRIFSAAREACDVGQGSLLDVTPDAFECVDDARRTAHTQLALAEPRPAPRTMGGAGAP